MRHLTVTREYQPAVLRDSHGKRTVIAEVYTDDISFSGFGAPVSVSAPPASKILKPELVLTEP